MAPLAIMLLPTHLESPVDIASYGWKNINFEAATQDELTEYQGVPNEKNNKLWTDSFNLFGISKITMEEARPLKNRTVPMDDEGHYIVTLDVFHQLHCLNKLREKIYWNVTNYGEPEHSHLNVVHIDHCIDQLRQSLMCTVDVTPIPYEWYPKYGAYMPSTGIMHTCRNFEAVQNWAKKRPAGVWDTKKYRVDPLGDQTHVYKEWWCKENGGCEGPQQGESSMDGAHSHGDHHG
ncbi:hypothetical protein IQ06DRAFT_357079 [Phaeosphaeriaceae sp. SRC1lsM3a]|nr:hypothetical protein IQ06DRAFT_357079 [Stagonospora sp. SRC1lsM3a]